MFFEFMELPSLLHPLEMIARTPHISTASSNNAVSFSGSFMTMLPNPIYTGCGPERRNASRSADGVYFGSSRKKNPQTSIRYVSMLKTEIKDVTYQYRTASQRVLVPEMVTNNM
jgi:hypothetical protein